jgi:hypothetical protein
VSGRRFRPSCVSSLVSGRKRNSRFAANTRAQRVVRVGTPMVGRERIESAADEGAMSCEVKGSSSSVFGPPKVLRPLFVRFRFAEGPLFKVPAGRLDMSAVVVEPAFK